MAPAQALSGALVLSRLAGHGLNSQFSTGGDFLNIILEWLCVCMHVFTCACACMCVYIYGMASETLEWWCMYIVHKCLWSMHACIVLMCVCEGRE